MRLGERLLPTNSFFWGFFIMPPKDLMPTIAVRNAIIIYGKQSGGNLLAFPHQMFGVNQHQLCLLVSPNRPAIGP